MNKKTFVLSGSIAVALCATGLRAPAAADEVPAATPSARAAPPAQSNPRIFAMYDAFIEYANSIAMTQKASSDRLAGLVTAPASDVVPTATPAPRAAPIARSYPRTFYTYDALVDYASSVATTQQESNDRLAALMVREDAARAALAAAFDPRARGGLLQSRTDLTDDTSLKALRTELANDAATRQGLVTDGAVAMPAASWQLPLVGEDTQDFGPTPYQFEPALTYQGVFYPHFHSGTDIAAEWGTPILAPARGVVVFVGTMGDGAKVVVIAHDAGLVSMYAHLEDRVFPSPVKAGDRVEAGDRIGNVGRTGIITGTHLHWSVWRNGEPIDPLSTIRGSHEPTRHVAVTSQKQ